MANLLAIFGGACLAVAGVAAAADSPASDRFTMPQLRMEGGTLLAYVSVVDNRGVPAEVAPANFRLLVDGRTVDTIALQKLPSTTGISILLGIDVSRSMQPVKIRAARQAAAGFINRLRPNDHASLFTFGDQVRFLAGFTQDKAALMAHLVNMEARDQHTLLYDAIVEAARRAPASPTVRKALVILTDGQDDGSSVSLDNSIQIAQMQAAPVYTLGFGVEINRAALTRISAMTGGRFFAVSDAAQLAGFYLTLLNQLSSEYVLQVPGLHLAPGRHTLRAELNDAAGSFVQSRAFETTADAAAGTAAIVPAPPHQRGSAWVWCLAGGLLALVAAAAWRLTRRQDAPPAAPASEAAAPTGAEAEDQTIVDTVVLPRPADRPPDSPPAHPAAWLEMDGRQYPLGTVPLTMGRGEDRHLRLTGDAGVSRRHAVVQPDANGRFVLTDEGSAGGTFINGRRMQAPQVLRDGDRLGLGSPEARVTFHLPA
jgi:hypothetical protein